MAKREALTNATSAKVHFGLKKPRKGCLKIRAILLSVCITHGSTPLPNRGLRAHPDPWRLSPGHVPGTRARVGSAAPTGTGTQAKSPGEDEVNEIFLLPVVFK